MTEIDLSYDFDMEVLASLTEQPAALKDLADDFNLVTQLPLRRAIGRLMERGFVIHVGNVKGYGRAAWLDVDTARAARAEAQAYWSRVHGTAAAA
jgi:hypothetical protein